MYDIKNLMCVKTKFKDQEMCIMIYRTKRNVLKGQINYPNRFHFTYTERKTTDHELEDVIKGVLNKTQLSFTKRELDNFIHKVITEIKLMFPDTNKSRRIWGINYGDFKFKNKKYYALTYVNRIGNVISYIRDKEGSMMIKGCDETYSRKAIANAFIKAKLIKNDNLRGIEKLENNAFRGMKQVM